MVFDSKIALILRQDLTTWQKLNVTAFTISGIAASVDDVTGEPYGAAPATLACRCSASRSPTRRAVGGATEAHPRSSPARLGTLSLDNGEQFGAHPVLKTVSPVRRPKSPRNL